MHVCRVHLCHEYRVMWECSWQCNWVIRVDMSIIPTCKRFIIFIVIVCVRRIKMIITLSWRHSKTNNGAIHLLFCFRYILYILARFVIVINAIQSTFIELNSCIVVVVVVVDLVWSVWCTTYDRYLSYKHKHRVLLFVDVHCRQTRCAIVVDVYGHTTI